MRKIRLRKDIDESDYSDDEKIYEIENLDIVVDSIHGGTKLYKLILQAKTFSF